MGDNRAATRAPGAEPAAEKKGPAPDAGGGGAVPEGAAADPGSALTVLAASYGAQLIGVLQGAGGNAEVDAELSSLQEGAQLAAKAKADKDAVAGMNDGEKVEKYGGKKKGEGGGGGAPAPGAENAPPPGVPEPGAASGFHASRAAELAGLANQHATVASSLGAAAAVPGLAPELVAFLSEGAAQSMAQQAALSALSATYASVGASLAGSEFIGAAMPGASTAALYENRAMSIQSVVTTLDTMCGEYDAALGAEQAKIAECDTMIADLMKQIGEASAKKGPEGGGGGGGGAPGAEAKTESKGPGSAPPGQGPAPAPAGKKGAAGAESKSASSGAGSTGNTGLPPAPEAAPQVDGAQAKAPGGGAGGGGGAAMTGAAGDPVAAITAQVEQQKTKKTGIESQISANQSLINAIRAYRDQMNALLAAYTSGSTPPGAAG